MSTFEELSEYWQEWLFNHNKAWTEKPKKALYFVDQSGLAHVAKRYDPKEENLGYEGQWWRLTLRVVPVSDVNNKGESQVVLTNNLWCNGEAPEFVVNNAIRANREAIERPTNLPVPTTSVVKIYTDGAYRDGIISWAFVVVDGEKVMSFSKAYKGTPAECASRNIAAEIKAARMAIKWCVNNDVKDVEILHDYEGIGKWARGEWKRNLPLTQEFHKFVNEQTIKIMFTHVKGHSGNEYNEKADRYCTMSLDNFKEV